MAHVKISQTSAAGPLRLEVDGVDLSQSVYNEGFGLVRIGEEPFAEWGIRMILAADTLDVGAPNAIVEAIRHTDEVPPRTCSRCGSSWTAPVEDCPTCEERAGQ